MRHLGTIQSFRDDGRSWTRVGLHRLDKGDRAGSGPRACHDLMRPSGQRRQPSPGASVGIDRVCEAAPSTTPPSGCKHRLSSGCARARQAPSLRAIRAEGNQPLPSPSFQRFIQRSRSTLQRTHQAAQQLRPTGVMPRPDHELPAHDDTGDVGEWSGPVNCSATDPDQLCWERPPAPN